MAIEKVSLSLDAQLVAQARRAAGHRGLSAIVHEGLRIRLQHERLKKLLEELDAEHGPVPAKEIERARKTWPDPRTGKRESRHRV